MKIERTVLVEASAPFVADVDSLDLAELRMAFSALFDRTAEEVFRYRLDLDDVVVDRFLLCQAPGGATVRVPLPSLADRSSVVACLTVDASPGQDPTHQLETMSIVEIIAAAIREEPGPD